MINEYNKESNDSNAVNNLILSLNDFEINESNNESDNSILEINKSTIEIPDIEILSNNENNEDNEDIDLNDENKNYKIPNLYERLSEDGRFIHFSDLLDGLKSGKVYKREKVTNDEEDFLLNIIDSINIKNNKLKLNVK